jgi:nucleotide-binding universal stress UspA family protein
MHVVFSADGSEEAAAARQWCVEHLAPTDTVTAVVGVNGFQEFVIGVPPFDTLGSEAQLAAELDQDSCAPLREAGLSCRIRLVHHAQGKAVVDVAAEEGAELIVVGKRPHGPVVDAILGTVAGQVVHHPSCPVVVVPVRDHRGAATAASS